MPSAQKKTKAKASPEDYPVTEDWSKDRRFREATKRVLLDGWTQTDAAVHYGVSRQQLNRRVRARRPDVQSKVEAARTEIAEKAKAQASSPLGLSERRRVPPPAEFHRKYFGHVVCPDCHTRHDMPAFHEEILGICQDEGVLRGGVNLPPYHAKTTVGSIRDTLYDICKDPNSRTLIVSRSQPFSQQILQAINEALTNHELYDGAAGDLILDWGPFKEEGQSVWNQKQIYVSGRVTTEKDPTVQVLGWGNQIFGRRADKIKFDDVADSENQRNPEQVARMLRWIDKDALSRVGQTGRALWFGTRVAPGDIYSVLAKRQGYHWLRYPFVLDDDDELTLWPEHMGYPYALVLRDEKSPADWQLIYQNVELPGDGASFTEEIIEGCKDTERSLGHWENGWRLVAGLDLAGGSKGSGYTAFTVLALDPKTGVRYLVDQYAEKSMKAPNIKDKILEWSERYPIFEWRVEANGVQSNLVQYDVEIIRPLALRGIRVLPHYTTGKNKWDEEFGVETIAPMMANGLVSIPWATPQARKEMGIFFEECIGFPMAPKNDRVMSYWFAELGCRDLMRRQHLPLFDERTKRWPARVRRRRQIVDFHDQEVRRVPLREQFPHQVTVGQSRYRRQMVGAPKRHDMIPEDTFPERRQTVNTNAEVFL